VIVPTPVAGAIVTPVSAVFVTFTVEPPTTVPVTVTKFAVVGMFPSSSFTPSVTTFEATATEVTTMRAGCKPTGNEPKEYAGNPPVIPRRGCNCGGCVMKGGIRGSLRSCSTS